MISDKSWVVWKEHFPLPEPWTSRSPTTQAVGRTRGLVPRALSGQGRGRVDSSESAEDKLSTTLWTCSHTLTGQDYESPGRRLPHCLDDSAVAFTVFDVAQVQGRRIRDRGERRRLQVHSRMFLHRSGAELWPPCRRRTGHTRMRSLPHTESILRTSPVTSATPCLCVRCIFVNTLGVEVATVRDWASRGGFRCFKLGRQCVCKNQVSAHASAMVSNISASTSFSLLFGENVDHYFLYLELSFKLD